MATLAKVQHQVDELIDLVTGLFPEGEVGEGRGLVGEDAGHDGPGILPGFRRPA